jgi:hypothetical protein
MNKWLRGSVALGLGAAGSIALAGPGSAQTEPLQATIEPASIAPDGTVTISSIDPCFNPDSEVPGTLTFLVTGPEGIESDLDGPEDLQPDEDPELNGQWANDIFGEDEVGNPAPLLPGAYTVQVTCVPDGAAEPAQPYVPLSWTVTEAAPPSTEAPGPAPEAPPAAPVSQEPNFTG